MNNNISWLFGLNSQYLKLQHTFDSTHTFSKVINPELPVPEPFNYGFPDLPGLLQTMAYGRVFAMHCPCPATGKPFFEYNLMTEGYFTFMRCIHMDISACLYNGALTLTPLEIGLQGGHIGNTSLSTISTMTAVGEADRPVLLRQLTQVVFIDKLTRRPKPVAQVWKDTYRPHCVRDEGLTIQIMDLPVDEIISTYEVKVAWSDTDVYRHTNFTSYARFALNAAHDCLKGGRMPVDITEADLCAGISQVRIAYIGECVEGDTVVVKICRPDGGQRSLLFSMETSGRMINQLSLSFHPPEGGQVVAARRLQSAL